MQYKIANKLSKQFMDRYPEEAATELNLLSTNERMKLLKLVDIKILLKLERYLPSASVADWISILSIEDKIVFFKSLETPRAAQVISHLDEQSSTEIRQLLPKKLVNNIDGLLHYSDAQAGSRMDRRILPIHENATVGEAIKLIQEKAFTKLRVIFLVDSNGRLIKFVHLQDLLFARKTAVLTTIAKDIFTYIRDTDPMEHVLTCFEKHRITDLPVVDYDGKLMGVIRYRAIVDAAKDSSLVDLQTMVGVSKEERALSNPLTVVAKRLPWLQINLLTAFLAAAVVALFEGIISKVTALAVLLPVVAGQSGNTGAQALAVTMRGLVLREIHIHQWPKLLFKEFFASFLNGVAIAITTAIGVYIWSQSMGLVLIIFISMIISMVIASLAGASIPIILTKLKMDPAQSSSIFLTTVTDVAGFFSFLGTASLLIRFI